MQSPTARAVWFSEWVHSPSSTIGGVAPIGPAEMAPSVAATNIGLNSGSPDAYGSSAYATSADGSVVVGLSPQGSNFFGAFRWTVAQGMQPLPSMQTAYAVSADGTMIVGGLNAWVNTSTGQSGTFGMFPGSQYNETTAFGVSSDGQIAVGYAQNGSNGGGPTLDAISSANISVARFSAMLRDHMPQADLALPIHVPDSPNLVGAWRLGRGQMWRVGKTLRLLHVGEECNTATRT
jgi:hypothetical protein